MATEKHSYFIRHWKGQLSLPISFWINYYLLSAIIVGFARLLTDTSNADSRSEIGVLLTALLGLLALTIWQVVGVWRSADNQVQRGGTALWARLAQILCVITVLSTTIQATNMASGFAELTRITFGIDDLADFNLLVLGDGSELEISGAIAFGLADELEKVLQSNATVNVIHLNSRGGRISEAWKVRKIISELGLGTYTSSECISACTVAYLGGKPRYLKDTARLGFHRYQFPGATDVDFEDDIELERDYMRRSGIEESFIQNATSKLADDMWYPSHEDLLDSGFVDSIISGDAFANSGVGLQSIEIQDLTQILEQGWENAEEYKMFRLLAMNHPEVKLRFFDIAKRLELEGGTLEDVRTEYRIWGHEIGVKYFPIYAANAQDDELLDFLNVIVDLIGKMIDEPGDGCYTWMFGGFTGNFPFSEAEMSSMAAVMTGIIESAILDPATPPDALAAETYVEQLLDQFAEREGDAALADLALMESAVDSMNERRRVCEVARGLYRTILQLEPENAANTARALFSSSE